MQGVIKNMVIGIFGESCTGKSTLADKIANRFHCEVFTGKDYLRLAKNENIAKVMFQKKLTAAVNGENIVYVISEKEHLPLLPEGTLRILVTADLELIKSRFAQRMGGTLPAPVATMLGKKHGTFHTQPHDIHVVSGETNLDTIVEQINEKLQK
jgi:cytidylate kinase